MTNEFNWCLIQLGDLHQTYHLRVGLTEIGRNKKANIITKSDICSRTHCIIQLTNNNEVTIEDKSSNGVYVNDEKITSTILKHNDVIGLGCTEHMLNEESKNPEKFYVFKLIATPLDAIDVSDDEGQDDLFSVEPEDQANDRHIVDVNNEIVLNESPKNDIVGSVVSDQDMNEIDDNQDAAENDEDIEVQYSQQCVREIKQEVSNNCSFEAHDNDFIICDDSDNDDDANNQLEDNEHEISLSQWCSKLSQNQDFDKRSIASSESKKRKATLMIDALPEQPKRRRKSIAGEKPQIKRNEKDETKANEIVVDMRNDMQTGNNSDSSISKKDVASTSKDTAPQQTTAVEVLVSATTEPHTKKNKKKRPSQPTTSFEDALKEVDTVRRRPQRIAHVPKDHDSTALKSILRDSTRRPTDSHKRVRNCDKKVGFKVQEMDVRIFVKKDHEDQEILVNPHAQRTEPVLDARSRYSFEIDSLDRLINEITEWDPAWLAVMSTPPINGLDFSPAPLMDDYPGIELYHKINIPLLKFELWSSIQAEEIPRKPYEVSVNSVQLMPKANGNRQLIFAQMNVDFGYNRIHIGTFVMVTWSKQTFFAYISQSRYSQSGYTKLVCFTMEVSARNVRFDAAQAMQCSVTPISNIRTELKLFNAVLLLNTSPLKELILCPRLYQQPEIPDRKMVYNGFGKCNEEQEYVVETVYNKCLHSSTNLTLVEGPPGTGKTRLIVSMITQLIFGLNKELRILVLAPSNAAVDIIARRLLDVRDRMHATKDKQQKLSIVRYGVLSSMHPEVTRIAPDNLLQKKRLEMMPQDSHLDHLIATRARISETIKREKNNLDAKSTFVGDKIDDLEKRLKQTNETIEKRIALVAPSIDIKHILAKVRVVCSTVSSAINLKQYVRQFDVCFLDEASQCTEAWSLVPLLYNISSYILVGDSLQLSPVVLSPICRSNNMERSLFTRLFQGFGDAGQISNAISITKQYRMHPEICSFPNKYFYGNRLQSVNTEHSSNFLLMPYTVFSLDCKQSNTSSVHYYNQYEAEFILSLLKVMIRHADPKAYSYGIITPYAAQTRSIKKLLGSSTTLKAYDFPVNTIDSYQGQEKDIIIFATTRTSGVGFLANSPRLNVALTRAKKSLVICGNFTSFSNVRVWKMLLEDADRRGKKRIVPRKYGFDYIAKYLVKPSNKEKSPAAGNSS